MKKILFLSLALVTLMACTKNENPLLVEQNTPFGVPAFDKVKIEHYLPALRKLSQRTKQKLLLLLITQRHLPLPIPLRHSTAAANC